MRLLHSIALAAALARPCAAQPLPAILQSATSPSGHYTLTVTAPLGDPPPAGNGWVPVVYTLTDTRTGKAVWTRRQAATRGKGDPLAMPTETPPLGLFVADDATALALAYDGSFAGIKDPIGVGVRTPTLSELFTDDRAREARGLGWNRGLVKVAFIDVPSAKKNGAPRTCLDVRAPWGEHLLFDAHTCAYIAGGRPRPIEPAHAAVPAAEAARLLNHVLQHELVWCRATIAAAATTLPDVSDLSRKRDLELALQIAASLNLTDAIPDLRKLELAAAELAAQPPGEAWTKLQAEDRERMLATIAKMQSGKMPTREDLSKEMDETQAQIARYMRLEWSALVPAVHHTLRNLGEAPRAGVGVQVYQRSPPYPVGSREALLAANLVSVDERLKALASVKPGGQIWGAFEALGSPDGRGGPTQGAYYLYHFDTPEPFTLRITVRSENSYVIKSIEEIRPPLWREGDVKRTVINR